MEIKQGNLSTKMVKIIAINGEATRKIIMRVCTESRARVTLCNLQNRQKVYYQGQYLGEYKILIKSETTKTYRINGEAIELLDKIKSGLTELYPFKIIGTNEKHMIRRSKIGDAISMVELAKAKTSMNEQNKIEYEMSNAKKEYTIKYSESIFYEVRDIKADINQISFSSTTGILFCPSGTYVTYNESEDGSLTFTNGGEKRYAAFAKRLEAINCENKFADKKMILFFYENNRMEKILTDKTMLKKRLMVNPYDFVYYVPMNHEGVNTLKLLQISEYRKKIQQEIFVNGENTHLPHTYFDARGEDGTYHYLFIDNNLKELAKIKAGITSEKKGKYSVYVFTENAPFIKMYFEENKNVDVYELEKKEIFIRIGCDYND